jgi:hypothetical protein
MMAVPTSERTDIDFVMNDLAITCNTPEMALIATTARARELASASVRPSGVLRELALACWRGSATDVSLPPRRDDDQGR